MKNTVIFGDFKLEVTIFNFAVLSFRQVYFASLNVLTEARQCVAENAHSYFTILFSENGTVFCFFVSYIMKGKEIGPHRRTKGMICVFMPC